MKCPICNKEFKDTKELAVHLSSSSRISNSKEHIKHFILNELKTINNVNHTDIINLYNQYIDLIEQGDVIQDLTNMFRNIFGDKLMLHASDVIDINKALRIKKLDCITFLDIVNMHNKNVRKQFNNNFIKQELIENVIKNEQSN